MSSDRKCKKCGKTKPMTDFPTYKAKGISGRRHTCRECWNKKWTPVVVSHNNRYYHENSSGYRDRQKLRTARNRTKGDAIKRRNKEYAIRHPKKAAAKVAVMMAVRSGRLKRMPCQVCGLRKSHAHHDDYDKPLDVIWLCPEHHGERRRLINRYGDPDKWPEDIRIREFPHPERANA